MKIGAEDKKKLIIMLVLLGIAVPLVIYSFSPASGSAPAPAPATSTTTEAGSHPAQKKPGLSHVPAAREKSLDPSLRTDILTASQKIEYTGGTRNIFRMQEAGPVRIDTPIAPVKAPSPTIVVNNPPQAPPIPLKYYGYSNRPGEAKKAFLQDGDNIFVAVEGEVVERRYKIVKITNNSVLVEDVLNNNQQNINLTPPQTAG